MAVGLQAATTSSVSTSGSNVSAPRFICSAPIERGSAPAQAGRGCASTAPNLPAGLQPSQIDLGPGLTVARVVSVAGDTATIAVDVAANAPIGARDLYVAGRERHPLQSHQTASSH